MKPHLFLNNPRGEQKKFNTTRNIEIEAIPLKPSQAYKPQKNKLNGALGRFEKNRSQRIQERTIDVPEHLEYIRIDFFIVFNNNEPFKTKSRFKSQFGLVPVVYTNFNQSVLFAITDNVKFSSFLTLLQEFINSPDIKHPAETPYSIITLLFDFEFLGLAELLTNVPQDDVIFSFVQSEEAISPSFRLIYISLLEYIRSIRKINDKIEFHTDGITILEVKNINEDQVQTIAKNFDILYKIQSVRVPTIKENKFNIPELTWGFTISPPANKKVIIGVLDNGVRPIAPLANVLLDFGLDITDKANPDALKAHHHHGTSVASLAAVGLDYFNTGKKIFQADAFIVPIKILNFDDGYFNIYDIQTLIQRAINKGVRIFNLSVCGPGKMYNSNVSEYAYLLDKLAYDNDILIFIATGNLSSDDIEAMQANVPAGKNKNLHNYPNHFYNPFKKSLEHVCEATNICLPAESYNNITVGAIADNLIDNSPMGLTPLPELPAYYTRKSHIDYNKTINASSFTKKQINHNINKPDIVMPGGDLLITRSRMQVVGLGDIGTDYYKWDSGTSFASPLAANLAAKITGLYPALNMQSVKALILNSSDRLLAPEFLDAVINEIKNELSASKFHKKYEALLIGEKKQINERLSSGDLYRRLVGHGMPDIKKALYSDKKSVTTIIQDSIAVESHKVINLNIPDYLLGYSKSSYILTLQATLCYKFSPVWNNQLGYNPLHISFNFTKSVKKNNPVETADIIADRDHRFYKKFTKDKVKPEDIAKAKKQALGIKTSLDSWSEDFFPPATKPFSNTQQLLLHITKDEIIKVENQVSIVVRCTYKRGLDKATIETLMKSLHQFSIVLNISEKKNNELSAFDLYDELEAINELDSIAAIDLDDDLEAENEG